MSLLDAQVLRVMFKSWNTDPEKSHLKNINPWNSVHSIDQRFTNKVASINFNSVYSYNEQKMLDKHLNFSNESKNISVWEFVVTTFLYVGFFILHTLKKELRIHFAALSLYFKCLADLHNSWMNEKKKKYQILSAFSWINKSSMRHVVAYRLQQK